MNRIRELRKEKGLTQLQFCQKLNITQSTLSGWECERWQPDNETLIKLANYFDVSIDYLLGRVDKKISFAQIAKELRESNNLTQKQLSQQIGLSASAIGHLETGRNEPTASTLTAYANYFDISIDELLENNISPVEREAGATPTRKTTITPLEDEMLFQFREIGKRRGETAQRALITIAENMK